MPCRSVLLKARFVAPVTGPVLEDGAVLLDGPRIAAVGTAKELRADQVEDFGDAVMVPGLVNAHTHLELSLLAGLVPPGRDLFDWLRRMTERRKERPFQPEDVDRAVRAGIAQSLAHGVTTVGDISRDTSRSRPILLESAMRAVSFGELISIGCRRLSDPRASARAVLQLSDGSADDRHRLTLGISPHAPYSVEPETLRACAEAAKEMDAPVCIHLLETTDEEQFTRDRSGGTVDFLRSVEAWDDSIPTSGCGPVELLVRTGLLGPKTILAHANYATDADVAQIAAASAHVAYCPRTHRAFGHPPHRFREMLAAGINVCIGTDSLASNPSLSVLDELRFLHREYPDFPADELLALGTLRGALGLGFDDLCGSITVGKSADLVVIPLEGGRRAAQWDSILDSDVGPRAVYASGSAVSNR